MALVHFDANDDRIPTPFRNHAEAVIKAILDALRPSDEVWTVTHHEPAESPNVTVDFKRGNRTESLLLRGEDADPHSSGFRDSVRLFIMSNWPSAGR